MCQPITPDAYCAFAPKSCSFASQSFASPGGLSILLALNAAGVGYLHTKFWSPSLVTSGPVMSF